MKVVAPKREVARSLMKLLLDAHKYPSAHQLREVYIISIARLGLELQQENTRLQGRGPRT